MALTDSLFTGLSGLNVNQTWLNVIGNNIANSNTTAFKSSNVAFQPQFYVTDDAGSPASATFGGEDPTQEGLGAQIGSINVNLSQGQIQSTGVDTDMAINGQGYFVIQSDGADQYTRDGTFSLNPNNQLVNTDGDFVMGYGVNSNFQVVNTTLQPITIPIGQETIAQATANASLQGNLNSSGTISTNASMLTTQALTDASTGTVTGASLLTNLEDFGTTTPLFTVGQTITLTGSKGSATLPTQTMTVAPTTTVADLQNFLQGGMGVDPTAAVGAGVPAPGSTIVNATGGGQQLVLTGNIGSANAISIGAGDLTTGGGDNPLSFTDTGGANGESTTTSITVYDSLGTPVSLDVTAALASTSSNGSTWDFFVSSPNNQATIPIDGGAANVNNSVIGNGTLTFNTNGDLVSSTGTTIDLNRTGTGADPNQPITLNFGSVSSLTDTSSNLVSPSQDGFAIGTLNSFSIGGDGTITGNFSNGLTRTIGQVALATFANPAGLVNTGDNIFNAGSDSGTPTVVTPGAQGSGTLQAGALEQSNVDLSGEFINLIIASTGFSAASRVISTSNQLLQALLQTQTA
ncbi:MAG TPA: flagellar hook-basal body complex protein [Tepidisphaeraceae bacterium]|nr:flagellar hook-basal body complex protein [Tepidisphaeraceae bacterium]